MKWLNIAGLLLIIALTLAKRTPPVMTSTPCQTQTIVLPSGVSLTSEIAASQAQKEKGLAGRMSLAHRTGMLFLFANRGIYPFWMKNTLIPLDIIWMDNKKVTEIATLEPAQGGDIPFHTPTHEADTVLELNAGEAATLGFQVGSQLEWTPCSNQ